MQPERFRMNLPSSHSLDERARAKVFRKGPGASGGGQVGHIQRLKLWQPLRARPCWCSDLSLHNMPIPALPCPGVPQQLKASCLLLLLFHPPWDPSLPFFLGPL